MANCEKILIAGFSGAGKSSFLKELEFAAPDSEWEFSDLDQLILKSHREKTVAGLVEKHGWDKFRLCERQELEGWLKEEGKGVLALGGGTLTQMILDLYGKKRKIGICYLHASFEDCFKRLHLDKAEESALLKLGEMELRRRYEERQKIFGKLSWRIDNLQGVNLEDKAKEFWERVLSNTGS